MVAKLGYDEIAALLADMDPEKVLAIKVSPRLQERVETLLENNREGILTEEEKIELEHYLIIDHLFAMAKIKARRKLNTPLHQ